MEIILVLLIMILTASNIYMFYKINETLKKKPEEAKEKPKVKKQKISEEDKKKREKVKKAFNNLMEYDYDTAMKEGVE